MGEALLYMGDKRNEHKILIRTPEVERLLEECE
jgi:hypothetical protein